MGHTVEVSTVFLGIDHNLDYGSPILFETLVFGSDMDGRCQRYATWDEAEAGHRKILEEVCGHLGIPIPGVMIDPGPRTRTAWARLLDDDPVY
jgi:hypothetical protein